MGLNQQIDYLLSSHEFASNLPILQQIISQLNLSPGYPIILVGGTNGKGSTCAYLTTVLTIAGYRVGTFTSPHMFSYNERICINNQPISDNDLNHVLNHVISAAVENIGLFKTFTMAAHLHFMQQKVDIAVFEVGIGGLNDATNLFEPTISAITNVSLDHCQVLGDTLELIGIQKAGIFRSNKPAFIGMKNPPQSVIEYARKINSELQILAMDFGYICHEFSFDFWGRTGKYYSLPHPGLRGKEQLDNAALATAILAELKTRFPLSLSSIKTGILQTKLPGRLSILPGQPQIILDVAHNLEAVSNMLQNMLKLPFAKHNYAVFGIASDKDVSGIIRLAKEHFTQWLIAPINSKRCINNDTLAQIMQDNGVDKNQIISHKTIESALINARCISTIEDRIVCFGSFLVVEEAYKCN